jgi:hypothetical protein
MDAPSDTEHRRFTLIHLSVGMAVLGLIAAVLLPPFPGGGGRELARRENCTSNLKQVGIAIALYADLYGQRCPMDGDPPTLVGSLQLLSNVVQSPKIVFCPQDSRPGARPASTWAELTTNNISYAYVPNLIWQDVSADSIVALDRIYTTEKGSHWPANGNHKDQGGNVLFNDSHVRFVNVLPATLKDKTGRIVVLSP